MNLEIRWNNELHYVEAGNYNQGCMKVLKEFVEDNPDVEIPIQNFHVTSLDTWDSCEVGLDLILAIQYVANNEYNPYDEEPALDPDCDILKAARGELV